MRLQAPNRLVRSRIAGNRFFRCGAIGSFASPCQERGEDGSKPSSPKTRAGEILD